MVRPDFAADLGVGDVAARGSKVAGLVRWIRVRRDDGFFTQKMGLPWIVAFLVIMGEFFGSLGLLAGLLTRFTAASFIVIMLGAILTVHLPVGFFMNWFGQQQGEGYEYHLLMIGLSAALLVTGAGRWSLDKLIAERLG